MKDIEDFKWGYSSAQVDCETGDVYVITSGFGKTLIGPTLNPSVVAEITCLHNEFLRLKHLLQVALDKMDKARAERAEADRDYAELAVSAGEQITGVQDKFMKAASLALRAWSQRDELREELAEKLPPDLNMQQVAELACVRHFVTNSCIQVMRDPEKVGYDGIITTGNVDWEISMSRKEEGDAESRRSGAGEPESGGGVTES